MNTTTNYRISNILVAKIKEFEGCRLRAYRDSGGLLTIGVGHTKGVIKVNIPHNFFLDMIFGDLGQIKITSDDLMEIKGILSLHLIRA